MATILIVDDNEDIRGMIAIALKKRGYSVITADNGVEAVLLAAKSLPELILMDINMPELDGLEATSQIRSAPAEKRIPVIALTAHALPDDSTRALAAGCDAFHPKPVDFELLFEQMNQLIEGSQGDASTEREAADAGDAP